MGKYSYVSMPIKEVMENMEEFIIPENIRIIEYLWDKNILTTQTNNYEDSFSWISIGELSEENSEIFWRLVNEMLVLDEKMAPKFTTYKGISVPIVPGTKDPFEEFKPLIDLLKPQDVQKDGYMTVDEFFLNCTDCWIVINNPNYGKVQEPQFEDYDNIKDYYKACQEYDEISAKRRIKIVDRTKIIKPIEEYLEEAGYSGCYDKEEGKIFYNQRLYDGHMRYKSNQEPKKHL